MNIDQSKINQIRGLVEWARTYLSLSANFEISFWSHTCYQKQTIEYRIWIDTVFHEGSKDLDYLVGMIPTIKAICLNNKEIAA
jgi:hypothetical protein